MIVDIYKKIQDLISVRKKALKNMANSATGHAMIPPTNDLYMEQLLDYYEKGLVDGMSVIEEVLYNIGALYAPLTSNVENGSTLLPSTRYTKYKKE